MVMGLIEDETAKDSMPPAIGGVICTEPESWM